jgi:hypothetical protein
MEICLGAAGFATVGATAALVEAQGGKDFVRDKSYVYRYIEAS